MELELLSIGPEVLRLRLVSLLVLSVLMLPETLELPERLMSVEVELLLEADGLVLGVVEPDVLMDVLL
jgi:hypothetical protein